MKPTTTPPDRLRDLLSDRAIGEDLGADDERELARLLEQHPEVHSASYDLAAAAIYLALLAANIEALPARLRRRLLLLADSLAGVRSHTPRKISSAWLGWSTAVAASLLLLVQLTGSQRPLSLGDLRNTADSITGAWVATEDPDGVDVTGTFTWSSQLGEGFMSFDGLPPNNPDSNQYQLWIFDANRPDKYPVDGGVFDSTGDVMTVPIRAKLHVEQPVLFAVTLERPGGVVVSDRERLLVTAVPSH